MKIVHFIPYMHPAAGGPPVVVDRLSRELVLRGHDVRVLTTDLFSAGDHAWCSAPRPYGLDVFRVSGRGQFGFSRSFWSAIRRAARNCDVVHLHTLWTFASLGGAWAARKAGTPYFVMPHGMLDPNSVRRGRLKKECYGRAVEWPLLRRAAGMCYTHVEEERLARQTCSRLPPGYIIELGAESPPEEPRPNLRAAFLDRYPHLRDCALVLFLGRIHSKKGLDLLIPAFEQVSRTRPTAHLLLVGPGEPAYLESIRADVLRRGLQSRVTFTGLLSGRDKWGAMAASQLFILPSYQENFALAAVDAISSGLPVILSRKVNLWKDVVNAGAGRDCDVTLDSVAATLGAVLDDPQWRSTAAQAGANLLKTRFNWHSAAAALEGAYESVCSPTVR